MRPNVLPETIPNWIDGRECAAVGGRTLPKHAPATGREILRVARSDGEDVARAVGAARRAQPAWAALPAVQRGDLLLDIAQALRRRREEMAAVVAAETGMAHKAALGEVGGAVAQGVFMAGEGRRLYGRTTTSASQTWPSFSKPASASHRATASEAV